MTFPKPKHEQFIAEHGQLPNHIAIVMDGNGRWASKKLLPRVIGHRKGLETVKSVISYCKDYNISYLSLFAFSTENWSRPVEEVNQLMILFIRTLKSEINDLHKNEICLKVVGNIASLPTKLQKEIKISEELTQYNKKLTLVICVNYGGRWDIVNAVKSIAKKVENKEISSNDITMNFFQKYLQIQDLPDPDLLIRTSGERRISNFFLWQLAYTELYFTQCFWPDFNEEEFLNALINYSVRKRRFGRIDSQNKD